MTPMSANFHTVFFGIWCQEIVQIIWSKFDAVPFFSIRKLIHWIVTKKLFDNFIMLVILVTLKL